MDALETLEPRTAVCHPARLFLGLVIFLIASSFLNDRLDWTGIHLHVSVWPWILVLLGLAKMGDRRADGLPGLNRVAAALLFLGIWGLVNEYRIFDVSYRRSWPLLLIGAGVLLIVRSQEPPAAESAGDGR